jgi:hypothetical protein
MFGLTLVEADNPSSENLEVQRVKPKEDRQGATEPKTAASDDGRDTLQGSATP